MLIANKYFTPVFALLAGSLLFLIGLTISSVTATVHAQECVDVAINVGQSGGQVCGGAGTGAEDNVIFVYMKYIINFLAVGVGIAVAVSIVIAGFQYITSEGNPQKLSGAKNRLFHAIVALILFILMYALLQYLIPGGLL
jgi:hypothetical protein